MSLGDLPRLFRTTRHLRPAQVAWRMRRSLERRLWPWGAGVDGAQPSFAPGNERPAVPGLPSPGHAIRLAEGGPDWRLGACETDRLGTVTLHYHEWAVGLAGAASTDPEAATTLMRLLSDWLDRCGPETRGSRELAWNPFAVATRLESWVRMHDALGAAGVEWDSALHPRLLASFHRQACFLHRHLEWDLRGNHLVRDLAGLAWAGRFLRGPDAAGWLATATRLAPEVVGVQVLADGGHYERSPMYHLQVMGDVLALSLLVADSSASALLADQWGRMAKFAQWVRHPDGEIPLLNDAAIGQACAPDRMLNQAVVLGREPGTDAGSGGLHLEDSGLFVWHGDPWSVFFDVGPIGPREQPGHGHADNLTLESSFAGRRFLVDPGCHSYDHDARRAYDRSTDAHNTVVVDGMDSSEVWSIFRVGRRAHTEVVEADIGSTSAVLSASHDGYRCLPGRPRHARRVEVSDRGALVVADEVRGAGGHSVSGGFLLAPGWEAEPRPGGWELTAEDAHVSVDVEGPRGLRLGVENRRYHPGFGRELAVRRLSWSVMGPLPVAVRTEFRGA